MGGNFRETLNDTNEVWKDIVGYEGLYQISNWGRVWSVPRTVQRTGGAYFRKGRFRHQNICKVGYAWVYLYQANKQKLFQVHRLVALHFIPNERNLPEVNHKDEIKTNNKVENLEWISRLDNIRYGKGISRRCVPVVQLTLNREKIKVWESAKDVQQTLGYLSGNISWVCRGKMKTAYGFIWEYANKERKEVITLCP